MKIDNERCRIDLESMLSEIKVLVGKVVDLTINPVSIGDNPPHILVEIRGSGDQFQKDYNAIYESLEDSAKDLELFLFPGQYTFINSPEIFDKEKKTVRSLEKMPGKITLRPNYAKYVVKNRA